MCRREPEGYRVFNADPNVGGRYSALTAFGLVPSGLAGVDLEEFLDEAESMTIELAVDSPSNPGLILGAAIAGTKPLKDKLGIVPDGTHIVGFGDWAEQLIAESTGKLGKGILPVVLDAHSPELEENLPDLQIIRLVGDYEETRDVRDGEIEITGSLGVDAVDLGVRGRGSRAPAWHQPVRPARRRGCQGRGAGTARRPSGAEPRPPSPKVASRYGAPPTS